MASEKTSNIGLNKWVPSDYVKVNEFNDNFDKIDEVAADHAAQLAETTKESSLYRTKKSTVNFSGVPLQNLNFRVKNIQRPFLDNFAKLYHETNFYSNLFEAVPNNNNDEGGIYYFDTYSLGGTSGATNPSNTNTIFDGKMKAEFNYTDAENPDFNHDNETFYIPKIDNYLPHAFVVLNVDSFNNPNATSGEPFSHDASAEIVLFKDVNSFISVIANVAKGVMNSHFIEVYQKMFGNGTTLDRFPLSYDLTSYQLGVLFMGNHVTIYIKNENSYTWEFIGHSSFSGYEMYTENYDNWHFGYGTYLTNGNSVIFNDFKVYMTPGLGIRDETIIHYKDGTPYVKDGRYFFTATTGANNIHTSGSAIFSYDPDTFNLKLEGYLYDRYNNAVWPDSQTQIVIDEDTNEWWVYFSSFASTVTDKDGNWTSEPKTLIGKSHSPIISGINIIDAVLADDEVTGYDSYVIWSNDHNAWLRVSAAPAFNNITIQKAVDPLGRWSKVTQRTGFSVTEGPKFAKVNDVLYVVVPYERNKWMALNVSDLSNAFEINVNTQTGHKAPHCMIVPICKDNKTRYQIISMDGARANRQEYSWGGFWVYEADEQATGYEFDLREAY